MSMRACTLAGNPNVSRPGALRIRRGVSIIEMLIVMIMIGAITAFALPKVRAAQNHESTRSARREVQASLARAKGAAVQRGCRATMHIRSSPEKVWVTACKVTGTGLDTIGGVIFLHARYGVTVSTDADSIPFGPNSLGLGTATIGMGFTKAGYTSSMRITPIGRPIW
jgi:prepilin-type N-terminal cleavage/methylation domain-containing protein